MVSETPTLHMPPTSSTWFQYLPLSSPQSYGTIYWSSNVLIVADMKSNIYTHQSNMIKFLFLNGCSIEKLGLKTRAGQVKTLGTIFCFAGALTASLYKGKVFHIGHHSLHSTISLEPSEVHWTRGTFMLVGSCFSYAAWYIVQVCITW